MDGGGGVRTFVCVRTEGNPDLLQKHRIGDVDVASAILIPSIDSTPSRSKIQRCVDVLLFSVVPSSLLVGYIGYSLYARLVNGRRPLD